MKDWVVRSLKTFAQAFLGTLIPALSTYLTGGWPDSWRSMWVALAPVVAAAFSAAISAVWNIILEIQRESAKYCKEPDGDKK